MRLREACSLTQTKLFAWLFVCYIFKSKSKVEIDNLIND